MFLSLKINTAISPQHCHWSPVIRSNRRAPYFSTNSCNKVRKKILIVTIFIIFLIYNTFIFNRNNLIYNKTSILSSSAKCIQFNYFIFYGSAATKLNSSAICVLIGFIISLGYNENNCKKKEGKKRWKNGEGKLNKNWRLKY